MEEIEWLTPEELSNLTEEERKAYTQQKIHEFMEYDSEDENMISAVVEKYEIPVFDQVIIDSDAEEIQLPEYNPLETVSDDDYAESFQSSSATYKTNDGTIWSSQPTIRRKILAHNILRSSQSGPTRKTERLSIIKTFKLLMSDEMIDIIVRETNRKAQQIYEREQVTNSAKSASMHTFKTLTTSEFEAYLGILLLAGVMRSNYVHSTALWKTSSHPIFRATMSLQRFRSINRFIRFDDGRTREVRKEMDKSAAISDIFAMLNRNLQACYVAGLHVTVDEQLYPYRGGTGFTQYIPSKPAKYGIKVWWACDAVTSYPIKGLYRVSTIWTKGRHQGERVVKDLCRIFVEVVVA